MNGDEICAPKQPKYPGRACATHVFTNTERYPACRQQAGDVTSLLGDFRSL